MGLNNKVYVSSMFQWFEPSVWHSGSEEKIIFVPQMPSRVATPFNCKGQPVTTFVRFNALTLRGVNINSYLDGRDCHHGPALFKVRFCLNKTSRLSEKSIE